MVRKKGDTTIREVNLDDDEDIIQNTYNGGASSLSGRGRGRGRGRRSLHENRPTQHSHPPIKKGGLHDIFMEEFTQTQTQTPAQTPAQTPTPTPTPTPIPPLQQPNASVQAPSQSQSNDERMIMQLNVNPLRLNQHTIMDNNNHNQPQATTTYPFDRYFSTMDAPEQHPNEYMDIYEKASEIGSIYESQIDGYDNVPFSFIQDHQDSKKYSDHQDNKVVKLLHDFDDKSLQKEWPSSTTVACFWCCHKFFNVPFGIPVTFNQGVFHVFGCFCSLECALAYNMSSQEQTNDVVWERNNLLHLLARKMHYSTRCLRPAPPRLALRIFGGYLSIEEFRQFTQHEKKVQIHFPPMKSIIQQIEEINESEVNSDYHFIPLDTERINKYKEKIRLRRKRPLHDMRNTLDNVINIKITHQENKQ